ncbi:2030_t:CDS:2 [Acaulospora colombiana]|uniref:2030_t:CDS:1 n=1 Tax=Acaulospora colombiana TaxID=27376 RepID=A0ACA9LSS6_9GLOM|nr:2030_t:CDS:2 [Acaulospora colombiana]
MNNKPTDPEKSELYDPHRPSYPEDRHSTEAPTKVQQVTHQIEETKTEIQKSLQELANRGRKLEDLEEQTEQLCRKIFENSRNMN